MPQAVERLVPQEINNDDRYPTEEPSLWAGLAAILMCGGAVAALIAVVNFLIKHVHFH